jgi:hypothetical protein
MEEVWVVSSNVALFFAAIVTTTLVVLYGVFTRWERTQVGRQFMLTKTCFAIVLDFSAVVIATNPRAWQYTPYTITRFIIYAAVGIIMLRWLIILIREQRAQRAQQRS